ncbi:platelet binding protein GspB-like [Haliotis asinina]|uniref:platelet binding protein GspB-like n=1 Tax=Haliotis asinina TaxID=109174 RepID=UPI003531F0C0
MPSSVPAVRRQDNDALVNSKDCQYIMATSEFDMGSTTLSSTNSSQRPNVRAKKPVRGDNSIKAKDYHYIMDTSASDVSSSSSSRSRHESVGSSASPSRNCQRSPRGSPTGSDNVSTEPSKKQHPADSSIKAKDYLYIMDTSASDVSSSSSGRSRHASVHASSLPSRTCQSTPRGSVCTSALPSRCQNNPHGSPSGSDNVSIETQKKQHPARSSIKAKECLYIMDTSVSDVSSSSSSRSRREFVRSSASPSRNCQGSPHGFQTGSDNVSTESPKKQHPADGSIKTKDYLYIMDTSASDVSSSSSSRSRRESVRPSASPSRNCQGSPHGSPTGSDNVSTESPKKQHPADGSMKAKDYHYIMDTSASDVSSSSSGRSRRGSVGSSALPSRNCRSSPQGSPSGSHNVIIEPPKKQHPADSSIKAKDYHYIMDTSASDGSSSSSSRSHRESVGTSALPCSCRGSPRVFPTGSDKVRTKPPRGQHTGNFKKPDDRSSTSPKAVSDTSSSPSLYPRSLTASNHSVQSSEILSSVSSDSESVFDPFVEDHLQRRLSSREPSVDAQFPVAETISEISLVNRSDESWFTGTRESNSFYQEGLHQRKLRLDQAWVTGDRKKSMSDWVSSVHVWEDDGEDKDITPRREKLQKRMQSFISRVFVCGGQSQA